MNRLLGPRQSLAQVHQTGQGPQHLTKPTDPGAAHGHLTEDQANKRSRSKQPER